MKPFRSYSAYLKERYGERVHRVALDAGFGCPHRVEGRGSGGCIYCGPAGSGSGAFDRGLSVKEQMRRGIARLAKSGIRKYVAYFQAFSNTGADPAELRRIYLEALSFPDVVGLAVGTRPDMISDEVLALLGRLATVSPSREVWLELGLQSSKDATLRRIRRGHDVACFDDAVIRAHAHGLLTAAHVILGLPGEGEEEMMATADHIARLPIEGVKLHHLFVERGTDLARLYADEAFPTLSPEGYMDLAISFLRRLNPDMIVMRLAGRAAEERLIAPRWRIPPGAIAARMEEEMLRRGVRQGDLWKGEDG